MAKKRNGSAEDLEGVEERHRHGRSRKRKEESSEDRDEESADERERGSRKKRKHGHRRSSRRSSKRSRRSGSESESEEGSSTSASYSESSSEDSVSDSDSSAGSGGSEEEERRRKRRRKDRERKRTKEKERRRRKKREEREKKKKKKKEKTKKKKKEKDLGKRSAVTNSWGRYGIIRETDMWNKRPEFTAWLSEVKKVNLESLANWEEKQMFKEFMEDHNTATFPSKKYYGLDPYHMRMMNKDMKRASKKYADIERTVFNDEELRRQEMLRAREKHKDEQVEALKRSMETGMAQAMKEQAQLKEEMAYQYKLGNFEAAAAIQRRLDPDIAM